MDKIILPITETLLTASGLQQQQQNQTSSDHQQWSTEGILQHGIIGELLQPHEEQKTVQNQENIATEDTRRFFDQSGIQTEPEHKSILGVGRAINQFINRGEQTEPSTLQQQNIPQQDIIIEPNLSTIKSSIQRYITTTGQQQYPQTQAQNTGEVIRELSSIVKDIKNKTKFSSKSEQQKKQIHKRIQDAIEETFAKSYKNKLEQLQQQYDILSKEELETQQENEEKNLLLQQYESQINDLQVKIWLLEAKLQSKQENIQDIKDVVSQSTSSISETNKTAQQLIKQKQKKEIIKDSDPEYQEIFEWATTLHDFLKSIKKLPWLVHILAALIKLLNNKKSYSKIKKLGIYIKDLYNRIKTYIYTNIDTKKYKQRITDLFNVMVNKIKKPMAIHKKYEDIRVESEESDEEDTFTISPVRYDNQYNPFIDEESLLNNTTQIIQRQSLSQRINNTIQPAMNMLSLQFNRQSDLHENEEQHIRQQLQFCDSVRKLAKNNPKLSVLLISTPLMIWLSYLFIEWLWQDNSKTIKDPPLQQYDPVKEDQLMDQIIPPHCKKIRYFDEQTGRYKYHIVCDIGNGKKTVYQY